MSLNKNSIIEQIQENAADVTSLLVFSDSALDVKPQPGLKLLVDDFAQAHGEGGEPSHAEKEIELALNQVRSLFMGNLDGPLSTSRTFAAAAQSSNQVRAGEAKKHADADFAFRALLAQIEEDIARLNQEIVDLESGFAAEHGDAWREKLAARILDVDDIPQQENGESIEAYRERLEKILIEQMLNDDGTIKDVYKDDPELSIYAEWAEKRYNKARAEEKAATLKDPNSSPAQKEAVLTEIKRSGNAEEATFTAVELEGHKAEQAAVEQASDVAKDKQTMYDEHMRQGANFDNGLFS